MKTWRVPYPKFGDGVGLARVAAIAQSMGLDLAGFGAQGAVITGSNGKGSTAAMLASIVRESNGPVGLFTSPHLLRLNERFNIDGEDVSDAELETHWQAVSNAIDAWRENNGAQVGGFEFLFLIAASWFAARQCRYTIWEAGIGGRYDPVRLIQARRTALTSLDLEHTALLGNTLEEIARDKLDATPAGATAFVSESCLPQRAAIEAHAHEREINIRFVSALESSPLPGAHQLQNAALALALARDMAPFSDAQIAHGFAATIWPGRLEIINQAPLVVIDVGHTPAGIAAALDGFRLMTPRPDVLVCGVSIDKNVAEIAAALAPAFDRIICAQPRHKGRPAAEIAAAVSAAHPGAEISLAESMADARALALHKAGADGAVYVAGGLFLAAEFKAAHLGLDPASLLFF